jgi:hypothetical protein
MLSQACIIGFVSSFSWSTLLDVMCNKQWHISDKNNHISVTGVSVGSDTITTQATTANKLASYFTSVLSSDSFSPAFKHLSDNAAAFLVTSPVSFDGHIFITTSHEP